ncbi:43150_t:CDS:2, partial [Gigaspora margarita]
YLSQDKNSQVKNSQAENSQVKNSQAENSQAMNSQESVQKKTSGWPPAGVWNFFNKGSFVKGHYSGTYKECGSFWAHAKPVDLEECLALDCPTQNKDVIDFYTQIIANWQELQPGYQPLSRQLLAEYLWKLVDLSNQSHIDKILQDCIQQIFDELGVHKLGAIITNVVQIVQLQN